MKEKKQTQDRCYLLTLLKKIYFLAFFFFIFTPVRSVSAQMSIVKLNFSSTSELGARDVSERQKEKHKECGSEKIEGDYVSGRHRDPDKAAQASSLHGKMSGCCRKKMKEEEKKKKKNPSSVCVGARKQINR